MALFLGTIIVLLGGILIITSPSPFKENEITKEDIREHSRFNFLYINPNDKRLFVPTSPLYFPLNMNLAHPRAAILCVLLVFLLLVFVIF